MSLRLSNSPKLFFALLAVSFSIFSVKAQTGTWTEIATNAPHDNMGVMLLLTNGSVICHNTSGGSDGTGWDMLTPNATGSYVNGTWTSIASMHTDRLFFSSQVLPSGEVYVAGGEYSGGNSFPLNVAGEVYNPATNTWTVTGAIQHNWSLSDAPSQLLYNGNILEGTEIGANGGQPCMSIEQWSPTTLDYTTENNEPEDHDEALWLKLPDSTVLTIGMPWYGFPSTDSSCRFQPKTNTWLIDNMTPNNIYDEYGEEAGCGTMLPNGNAIFFGATKYNEIYTPSGNSKTKGTWTAAANFPTINGNLMGQPDAPGAMMINGHELLAVSPEGTSANNEFNDPIYFLEYNYVTNTFTQVRSTIPGIGGDSIPGASCYQANMLDLPNGQVLVSVDQDGSTSAKYWVYTPGSAEIPQGIPTINSIYQTSCSSYYIRGKLFNGISEGATEGDDWQMSTNYPLVRLTSASGNVYYATTSNWNRVGAVQTDSLEDTAEFVLPATLPTGTYSLVVVANGFPSNPTLFTTYGISSITATANVTCNGGSNGNATAVVQGGETPYTYKWSNGTSTVSTSNPTGPVLSAGTYTLTVSDVPGCTTTASIVITQPTAVAITIASHVNSGCTPTGSATANAATGGTTPYTYSWSPSGGTNLTATGLNAGTYTITATDKNGCTGSASVAIGTTSIRDSVASITYPLCNGGTGSATIGVKDGTSPYTYSWAPNTNTTATASGLSVGSYTVTVKDHAGCSSAVVFSITQPNILVTTTSVTANVNCNGGSTGSASSSTSGGTSPYTYLWTGGGTNSTKTGLSAGTFTISVTDKNGCNATASVVITQPSQLSVSTTITTNVTCNGGNQGSASANPSGGTSPYTYLWSGGGTNSSKTGLSAGTFTITVTDKNGCTASATAIITQPLILAANPSVISNVLCNGGNTGNVSSTPTGGTSPYTYLWTGGSTNSTETGLTIGTYTISVTDNNGCTSSSSIAITQPTILNVTAIVTNNVTCGGNNGSVSSTSSGGTAPYTYLWTGGGTNSTESGLTAGTYTITLTDKNGCTASASTIITEPTTLNVVANTTANIRCNGGDSGSVSSIASGGTSPYTYLWTGGSTTSTETGLSAGTYTITITDKNGCNSASVAIITQPAVLSVTANITSNVSCFGGSNGSAALTTSGGTSPYNYLWTGGSTNSNLTGLSQGTYTIMVTDNNGCTATNSVSLTQPALLTVSTGVIGNVLCNGGNTGSANSTPSGGTSPYTYLWSSGGGTNATASNLSAGTYTLTLTDNNGCSAVDSAVITQPGLLITNAGQAAAILCNGENTGSASAVASGGTSPYTYSWSGGGTNSTKTGLSAGTYTTTITDNNGCTSTASAVLTQPTALIVATDSTNVTVDNGTGCNGGAGVTASGATPAYTYSWSPGGGTNDTIKAKCAGTYCCKVTDKNGCTETVCITIKSTVGIENITDNASSINIYPDPNNGNFTIQFAGTQNFVSEQWSVEMYNILGEKIYSAFNIHNSTFSINISDKANGVYLVRIKNEDGSVVVQKKIVKTQ